MIRCNCPIRKGLIILGIKKCARGMGARLLAYRGLHSSCTRNIKPPCTCSVSCSIILNLGADKSTLAPEILKRHAHAQ